MSDKKLRWYQKEEYIGGGNRIAIDFEKLFYVSLFVCIAMLIVSVFVCIVDDVINAPYAAEDALIYCENHGFTTYESYKRPVFSRRALGVKCEQPIKNYNIDGGLGVVTIE